MKILFWLFVAILNFISLGMGGFHITLPVIWVAVVLAVVFTQSNRKGE